MAVSKNETLEYSIQVKECRLVKNLYFSILLMETLEIFTSYARQAQFSGLNQLGKLECHL